MAASKYFPGIPSDWSETSIRTANDQLHIRIWYKKNLSNHVRTLLLVHGQAEQSDRYTHFPFYLHQNIDCIFAADLPGHGMSKGVRGHIENFDQYSSAVLSLINSAQDWLRGQNKSYVLHLLGHSLGGLITLRTCLKNPDLPLLSVTVSAPLLDLAIKVPPVKKFFGELVEPVLGFLKIDNELKSEQISHDPEVILEYHQNPLNHHWVTPRFFVNMMKETALMRENTTEFPYPLMIITPLADPIVSWKAQYNFFNKLKMKNNKRKCLQSFPGFFHEPFNEIGKERAFVALANWLESCSK